MPEQWLSRAGSQGSLASLYVSQRARLSHCNLPLAPPEFKVSLSTFQTLPSRAGRMILARMAISSACAGVTSRLPVKMSFTSVSRHGSAEQAVKVGGRVQNSPLALGHSIRARHCHLAPAREQVPQEVTQSLCWRRTRSRRGCCTCAFARRSNQALGVDTWCRA